MKKILAFALAAMMLLSLVSCGGSASSGTVVGDTYKNDGVGIKFTKPDGWEFLKDDELAVEMNTGGNSFKKQLENGVAYDAVAKDAKTGNMVIISFVNLEKKYSNKDMTVEEYGEEMKKQLKQVNPTSNVALSDVETVELDGEEFSRIVTGVTQNKITTRRVTFLKDLGGVMFSAQVVLLDNTSISDVEAMFN